MTINRRGALGAMIGGVVAGPKAVETVLKISPEEFLRGGMKIAFADLAKTTGVHPKRLARLRRVANGDIKDSDYDSHWTSYVSGSIRVDPSVEFGEMRSVSKAAGRVFAYTKLKDKARKELIDDAVKSLTNILSGRDEDDDEDDDF